MEIWDKCLDQVQRSIISIFNCGKPNKLSFDPYDNLVKLAGMTCHSENSSDWIKPISTCE